MGARTAYIALGSPWENGCVESFNARLRDELLEGEIFYTLKEAQIVIESWRRHYNAVRPPVLLWATSRRHPKCSCLPLPRGRLHALNPLRRQCSHWRRGRHQTNIATGPLGGGRSSGCLRFQEAFDLGG